MRMSRQFEEQSIEAIDPLETMPPAKKSMVIFFLVDTSKSMEGSKLESLNRVMGDILPELIGVGEAGTDVKVAVMSFSSGCEWITPEPVLIEEYQRWENLSADGVTDLGDACEELCQKLSRNSFLVTANIVRASQFNQNFKEEVDLKMYYYVIDSSYGETLPLQEVGEAKALAQELLSGTQDRQSRKAITSAIDLCENLHERIVQITETDGYEARMELLESNIYILTELIQQYFYTYLYHEAGYLDSLQAALTARLWLELGLVAAGALVLVGVLMRRSAAISRSITQPIYALRERAQSIGRGDLAAREPVVAEDETLQALSSSIEQMAQHLQQQMELNRQEQAKLRAMELALLQSQINPHFLYNTLDSINWMASFGATEEVSRMIVALSDFFHFTVSEHSIFTTVGQEVAFAKNYVYLQQCRFGMALQVHFDVNPDTENNLTLRLLLQPLIENAIVHGVMSSTSGGTVRIWIAREHGQLHLHVEDNGAGMDDETLNQLRTTGGARSIGLPNIMRRLELVYGGHHTFSIDSTPGQGTQVDIIFPAVRTQEELRELTNFAGGNNRI